MWNKFAFYKKKKNKCSKVHLLTKHPASVMNGNLSEYHGFARDSREREGERRVRVGKGRREKETNKDR